MTSEHPMPTHVPGVPEVTKMDYNENDSAKMTDQPLVRARGVSPRRQRFGYLRAAMQIGAQLAASSATTNFIHFFAWGF